MSVIFPSIEAERCNLVVYVYVYLSLSLFLCLAGPGRPILMLILCLVKCNYNAVGPRIRTAALDVLPAKALGRRRPIPHKAATAEVNLKRTPAMAVKPLVT